MYTRRTRYAIASMTRLAEVYDGGVTRLSASEIARSRGLHLPFAAKVLSRLAQAALVTSVRGPGGGFSLARHPRTITLSEVLELFEREEDPEVCPFGLEAFGELGSCPLQTQLADIRGALHRLWHETTFQAFRASRRTRAVPGRGPPAAKSRRMKRPPHVR